MDFALTDEQELIRDAVARVCADFPDEYWSEKDTKHEFPWDFYNAMSEAGWIGVAIPEAYGGSGRGITEASMVRHHCTFPCSGWSRLLNTVPRR
jgi:acyl-CoA dehydrogenase